MRLPRDIICAHGNRFRAELRHCVYSSYAAIKMAVLKGALALVLMPWTGPGHQGLVGCLAVKNESLHRINLCMKVDVRKIEIIKKSLLMPTHAS